MNDLYNPYPEQKRNKEIHRATLSDAGFGVDLLRNFWKKPETSTKLF